MIKSLAFLIVVTGVILSSYFAESSVPCPDVQDHQGSARVQQIMLKGHGCSIRFYDTGDSVNSRQWLFNSSGRVAAFANFAGTTNSNSTGARAFYIIPTDENYGLSGVGPTGADYKVQTSAGSWQVSKKTGQLTAPNNCKVSITDVSGGVSARGGFSLESCKNKLVMDVGWKVGNDPERNKEASSTFRDSTGHSCSVPNKKIFNYSQYDYSLKYSSAAQWARFLVTLPECKKLVTPWPSPPTGAGADPLQSGKQ